MVVVYDIETYKACFTYTDINRDTLVVSQFVLYKDKFELDELVNHLKQVTHQIGYNNIDFDYTIIHEILDKYQFWKKHCYTNEEVIQAIYEKAQQVIDNQSVMEYFNSFTIRDRDRKIKQLDLFKMWHYNNAARKTSLKALEISINYPNVLECSIHHSKEELTLDEVQEILDYNLNDVQATFEFYKLSSEKIDLRRKLNDRYNLNCLNFSDSKIGEQLVLKLYCEATGLNWWEVRNLRTVRENVKLSECIFDYIEFKTPKFKELANKLKGLTLFNVKGEVAESLIYKGFKYDIGSGGIHGCIKAGIYSDDKDYIIIDADVASLYPSIAIVNNLYPEHLGIAFCKVYKEDIVDVRLAAKKAGDMTLADGYKLAANSCYGKSNEKTSFLQDYKYTMKTTYNGQLMLLMLAEDLTERINDLLMIQINTDGLTVKIKRTDVELYYSICKEWMEKTKLVLEYEEYSKMVIRDVNNYSALSKKGKKKFKGCFEIDKMVGNEHAYHKDNSFRIVPIALSNYFFNGIPVEKTIKEHQSIYDFCGRQKFVGEDCGKIHYLDGTREAIEKQQKNTRYYISHKGATFVKYYKKGSTELINKGYTVTIFNKYIDKIAFKDYRINYDFYIKEANKIIDVLKPKQMQLL